MEKSRVTIASESLKIETTHSFRLDMKAASKISLRKKKSNAHSASGLIVVSLQVAQSCKQWEVQ